MSGSVVTDSGVRIELVDAQSPGSIDLVVSDGRLLFVESGPFDGRLAATQSDIPLGAPAITPSGAPAAATLGAPAILTPGDGFIGQPTLSIVHADGTTTTRLRVRSVDTSEGPATVDTRIRLIDPAVALTVDWCARSWTETGVVQLWLEISHGQPGSITVRQARSAMIRCSAKVPTLTHFGGDWANEWQPTTTTLGVATTSLRSWGAVRPHLRLNPAFLLSLDGDPHESQGTVCAAMVGWAGGVAIDAVVDQPGQVTLQTGANFDESVRVLAPGQVLCTPKTALAWSAHGTGALSRRLHRWMRDHVIRNGQATRSIVFNTWEATGFDLSADRVDELIDQAAEVGAELFLLDDGWFGVDDPRSDDSAGLGDWAVNPTRFPDGLDPQIAHAAARGLRVGLWIEPEMVNPRSALYRAHPEWVVAEANRAPGMHRNQLVLDLRIPEVADFVVGVIDRLLSEHPGISYLKWDANAPAFETDPEFSITWTEAMYAVMDRVVEAHPNVELMLCASGGGRTDVETLRRFHEVWLSDNTDPAERVRMQWAASLFYPASVIGAHVTRWGQRPVEFAAMVALSGRFGFDLDPASLRPPERAVLSNAADVYRSISGLVQGGDLFRLVSPRFGPRAALMYVSSDRRDAVVFAYQLSGRNSSGNLVLDGLDPGGWYDVRAVGLTGGTPAPSWRTTGAQLCTTGIWWPLTSPHTAAMWRITASDEPARPVIDLTDDR